MTDRRTCRDTLEPRAGRARRGPGGRLPAPSAAWSVLSRNWRCRDGELDVVATDGSTPGGVRGEDPLRGTGFGDPAEAVTAAQGAPDPPATQAWLRRYRVGCCEIRFDVMSVLWPAGGCAAPAAPAGCVLMAARTTWSVALLGVDGVPVEIEADISVGVPWHPHCSACRIRRCASPRTGSAPPSATAARNGPTARSRWPCRPPTLPKGGAGYDLALGVRRAGRRRHRATDDRLAGTVLLGELALDGRSALGPRRPARPAGRPAGRLAHGRRAGRRAGRGRLVTGIDGARRHSLADVLSWLRGEDDCLCPARRAAVADRREPVAGPRRRGRPARSPVGAGGRRGRRPPPAAHGPTGHRQDDAGRSACRACCRR